jgi:hypothetical protein
VTFDTQARAGLVLVLCRTLASSVGAAESPWLYGIFDAEPAPSEYLGHITSGGARGWVTATVAVGANTNDLSGADFSVLANQGHTVICRINHGYFPDGTIPLPSRYDDFAKRCANFVAHSTGCNLWTIGNELNIAGAAFSFLPCPAPVTMRRPCKGRGLERSKPR